MSWCFHQTQSLFVCLMSADTFDVYPIIPLTPASVKRTGLRIHKMVIQSLQPTVMPAITGHYFPPGLRLPYQLQSIWSAASYTDWWLKYVYTCLWTEVGRN